MNHTTSNETVFLALRRERGWSREELSARSGVPANSLFMIEHGLSGYTVCTAERLARAFGVSIQSLADNDLAAAHADMEPGGMSHINWNMPDQTGVTGLEYCRKKRRLKTKDLAEQAGVAKSVITGIELRGVPKGTKMCTMIALAKELGTTVDMLMSRYPSDALEEGDRASVLAASRNSLNVIDNYRVQHNLTWRAIGKRLGISHEGARKVCGRNTAKKEYVEKLSAYEGISVNAFLIRYAQQTPYGADQQRKT